MPATSKDSTFAQLRALVNSKPVRPTPYDQVQRDLYRGAYTCGSKAGFESHAFSRLFDDRVALGLRGLTRCESARTDGYLDLVGSVVELPMLLEIKTTLGWGSLGTAFTQFIAGRQLLMRQRLIKDCSHGLIVFSEFSSDWSRGDPDPLRPWAQLYRHLDELSSTFKMSALQITADGFANPALDIKGSAGRLLSIFE